MTVETLRLMLGAEAVERMWVDVETEAVCSG